jgi:hypothetical protein
MNVHLVFSGFPSVTNKLYGLYQRIIYIVACLIVTMCSILVDAYGRLGETVWLRLLDRWSEVEAACYSIHFREYALSQSRSEPRRIEPWRHNILCLRNMYRVTGRGGPSDCETRRIQNFLNNGPTDGDELVSLTRRPRFAPQEDSWYSFLSEAE